jgi:hypothetical protein
VNILVFVFVAGFGIGSASTANTAADTHSSLPAVATSAGLHDFDFQVGDWHVHHRVKRATGNHDWLEFDGTCSKPVAWASGCSRWGTIS